MTQQICDRLAIIETKMIYLERGMYGVIVALLAQLGVSIAI
jgi:hypothetical protein